MLVMPVYGFSKTTNSYGEKDYPLLFVVQCEGKDRIFRGKKEKQVIYSARDEIILKVLNQLAIQIIDVWLLRQRSKESASKSEKLIKYLEDIMVEKNHGLLNNKIMDNIPQIMGFDNAAILFRDPNDKLLYTITASTTFDASTYVGDVVKYPVNIGITGEVMRTKQIYVSYNVLKDPLYVAEVDNILNTQEVKNIIVAPLTNNEGEVDGILQIRNKLQDVPINDQDKHYIQSLTKLLGVAVQNADTMHELWNLQYGLFGKLDTMVGQSE